MTTGERARPSFVKGMLFIAVICAVIGLIIIFIITQRGDASAVNIPTSRMAAISVNVSRVSLSDQMRIGEQHTGLVMARRSSELGFEAGGRIAAISADVGDQVKHGQVLAKLDTRSLVSRLQAARAQISEAEAGLKLADSTRSRQKILVDKELLSSQGYEEVSSQVDAASARLSAAKAQAETLSVQIELSSIRAPFSGVVTERYSDEGAISNPGQPLLKLVESGVLEVRLGLPEAVSANLVPGRSYPVLIQGVSYDADLRTVTGVIDANQRTVTAIFDLPEGTPVSSGAVARLEIVQDVSQTGFWVPVSAMTEASRGLWSIYVVQPSDGGEQIIEKRLIDVLHAEAEQAFVRGALRDGDLFVVNGLQRIAPGQTVSPTLVDLGTSGQ